VLLTLESTGVYHTAPLPHGTNAVPATTPVQFLGPGEFVLGLFGSGGETTAFMVVNRDYCKGATARLKVTLPGNRIQELDRQTGQWSQGERLSDGHAISVWLSPGDGRLFRVVISEDPSPYGKNAVD
jgi:hypothetical protein